jgi:hypothetical protein
MPRAALLLLLVVSAFNLGRYSVSFSGSTAAWVALIGGVVVLALCTHKLLFGRNAN